MLYNIQGKKYDYIPLALINLNEDEKIFLRKDEILGHLEPSSIEINEIVTYKSHERLHFGVSVPGWTLTIISRFFFEGRTPFRLT